MNPTNGQPAAAPGPASLAPTCGLGPGGRRSTPQAGVALRYILSAAAAAVGLWLLQRSVQSQPPPEPPYTAQFRVAVGFTDTEPREWSGRVSVTGGELAGVQGWRFSQKDQAAGDGGFQFHTKVGQLENQLLKEHPYGQTDWNNPNARRVIPEGLIVQIRGGGSSARIEFAASAGRFSFGAADAPLGKRLAVLDGNGMVEQLPVERRLSEAGAADDFPALAVCPDRSPWVAWLSYRDKADEIVVHGGGQIDRLSGRGDYHAPAIACDGAGRVHVVWSQRDGETFHLYHAMRDGGRWSKPARLTTDAGSNLRPRLVSDGARRLALVWQGFRKGESVVLAKLFDGRRWSAEQPISEPGASAWMPAAAFGPRGRLWIAWDSYATGAYQIYIREPGKPVERVTRGEFHSVHPSIAMTAMGTPVVAWEESDALWGKDYSYIIERRGTVLYKNRRIRVAYREGSQWRELTSPVADAAPPEVRRFLQQPELATDGSRLYLVFRSRTATNVARIDYWSAVGRWENFVTWLDGDRWAPAIPLPSSVGRNSMRAAAQLAGGKLYIAWATDARVWPTVRYGDLDVFTTTLDAIAAPGRLVGGRVLEALAAQPAAIHPNEPADTRQVRDYRYQLAGKTYRILRGDLHRHTELSNDGAGDGTLDDLYRYDLDVAAMDYAHVADHQMGADEEYNWWLTQKSNDLYYMPRRFVPIYGYERSVAYPNGHRNVIWAERGQPVLRISPAEAKGVENSGPILYPYLHRTRGIATAHTSATEQGTDWRDNDPDVEPIVELYQGYESNYEHKGAPRAWQEGQSKQHQGPREAGYVWNAWAKSYKLGVQASSDHVSTHVSYACVIVEDFTRQGLLDAMRRRHTYAATDNLVVDFRIGDALMGDIITLSGPPKLSARIIGTATIRQIDVIRNNTYIHKLSPGVKDFRFEYVDAAPPSGERYYYIRAEQTDGNLAWSSPIWVK